MCPAKYAEFEAVLLENVENDSGQCEVFLSPACDKVPVSCRANASFVTSTMAIVDRPELPITIQSVNDGFTVPSAAASGDK